MASLKRRNILGSMWSRILSANAGMIASAVAAVLLLGTAGCNTAKPASQPAVRSDQQVAMDIESKIGTDSALGGQNIQVSVQTGVATLSGNVIDATSRSVAGNDAGTVDGVKTVVNDLVVQRSASATAIAPPSVPLRQYSQAPPPETARDRRRKERAAREHDREMQQQNAPPQNQTAENQPSQQPPPPPPPPEPTAPVVQAPPPPPRPTTVTVTVPDGTTLPVRITEPLNSGTAQADDVFHGALAEDLMVDGILAMPRGASVTGRVVDVKDATHFKGSSLLSIELTQVTSHGRQVPVVTEAYTKQGAARGKNTAEKVGGGAALGAIIGAIAGGGKGAAIGAGAGGAIGAGANGVTRGEQVQIAPETIVNFRLQSPITVTSVSRSRGDRQEGDAPNPTLEPR